MSLPRPSFLLLPSLSWPFSFLSISCLCHSLVPTYPSLLFRLLPHLFFLLSLPPSHCPPSDFSQHFASVSHADSRHAYIVLRKSEFDRYSFIPVISFSLVFSLTLSPLISLSAHHLSFTILSPPLSIARSGLEVQSGTHTPTDLRSQLKTTLRNFSKRSKFAKCTLIRVKPLNKELLGIIKYILNSPLLLFRSNAYISMGWNQTSFIDTCPYLEGPFSMYKRNSWLWSVCFT